MLCSIKGLNGNKGIMLIERFGSASEIFRAGKKDLEKYVSPAAAKAILELSSGGLFSPSNAKADTVRNCIVPTEKNDIRFVCIYENEYPGRLRNIPDAPIGLWYIGELPSEDLPSVALIGARSCSTYGEHVAEAIGEYLGKAGVQVISGMARGIDGISQRAALRCGGSSYGVLGCGVNICYPPSNRFLYDRLKESGGIISEYPPGTPAISSNFPPRNRIVSGLSDAVVVIEARQKSGTLITVDSALEQGREVFAVPGRITDRLSDGCNGLIGLGANVFLSPEIFIRELNEIFETHKDKYSTAAASDTGIIKFEPKQKKRAIVSKEFSDDVRNAHKSFSGPSDFPPGLSEEEINVLRKLSLSPITVDELCRSLPGYDYATISMLLMQLLLGGHVIQVSQGAYVRTYK